MVLYYSEKTEVKINNFVPEEKNEQTGERKKRTKGYMAFESFFFKKNCHNSKKRADNKGENHND